MNGFCGNCEYLKNGKSRGKHFCSKYGKQVWHSKDHKEIIKSAECLNDYYFFGINKEKVLDLFKEYLNNIGIEEKIVDNFINEYADLVNKIVEKVIINSGMSDKE
jgi:Zn-dependent M32 family carboxypeptidase